ncbi:MAG: hypothetical protein Q8P31_00175 [Bacillota bacterium]|nr:hypothetical protein [Bacillota bacterium]
MLPSTLQPGDCAPGFRLADGQGCVHDYQSAATRTLVLVFFRGNW